MKSLQEIKHSIVRTGHNLSRLLGKNLESRTKTSTVGTISIEWVSIVYIDRNKSKFGRSIDALEFWESFRLMWIASSESRITRMYALKSLEHSSHMLIIIVHFAPAHTTEEAAAKETKFSLNPPRQRKTIRLFGCIVWSAAWNWNYSHQTSHLCVCHRPLVQKQTVDTMNSHISTRKRKWHSYIHIRSSDTHNKVLEMEKRCRILLHKKIAQHKSHLLVHFTQTLNTKACRC